MPSLTIAVTSPSENDPAFQEAANLFVRDLRRVSDLTVTVPVEPSPGTRGFLELLSGIVVSGIKAGAFTAIYTFAKDLWDRYATAEVELHFPDDSILRLKGLSQREAEERIRQHLTTSQSQAG